jgi:uncharacterized protein (TIGR03118 family)
MRSTFRRHLAHAGLAAIAVIGVARAQNKNYVQTNLVSDTAGAAANTDPNLKGLWGVSQSPTSPFWVSDVASGLSTLYNSAGVPNAAVVVTIPPGAASHSKTGSPTGQVNNGTTGFLLANGNKASFIFATFDGTIAAWNGGTTATTMVDNSGNGASYTGLAIGISEKGPTLYAANLAQFRIDTFDTNFKPITLSGGFLDVGLEPYYAPFNIQRFGQKIVVTYALPLPAPKFSAGPGTGTVNIFDLNGLIIQRVTTDRHLNAPWGVAFAPGQFGAFSYALMVGNLADGQINAYDPFTGDWLGTMMDGKGNPISIPGLWALQFGSGSANGGDAITMYFAADIDGTHGLFGTLRPMADSVQP